MEEHEDDVDEDLKGFFDVEAIGVVFGIGAEGCFFSSTLVRACTISR